MMILRNNHLLSLTRRQGNNTRW